MLDKFRKFILWTLNTRVSPLAYLAAYASLAIGFFFTFFSRLSDVQNTLLFKVGILGATEMWAMLLLVSSVVLVLGLRFRLVEITRIGAMGNFVLWGFACFMYSNNQYWFALLSFGGIHMMCQGYLYLAASIDTLWQTEYDERYCRTHRHVCALD